jgi:predicted transcriptional regulator
MPTLVSIVLDDDVHHELDAQARSRGIGPAELLSDLATQTALQARRRRIWKASAAVGVYVATSPEGKAFHDDWGTPRTNTG